MNSDKLIGKPGKGDPRWYILLFLFCFVCYALTSPGFSRRPAQYLADVSVCLLLDWALARARGMRLVPLSAFVTSMGVLLLTDSPLVWPYAFVGAVSILSKHVLRIEGKHIFNPNNFGIVIGVLFFSAAITTVPGRWGGSLPGMVAIACVGSYVAHKGGRLRVAAAYVVAFAVGAWIRHGVTGAKLETLLSPATGAAFMLFTFYMITDPKTSPAGRWSQAAFGAVVGGLDAWLRHKQINNAPFLALFAVTSALPVLRGWPQAKATARVATAALILLIGFGARAWAQGQQEAPFKGNEGVIDVSDEKFFDPQQELKHYEHHLGLTPAQQTKTLALLKRRLEEYKKDNAKRLRFQRETKALHEKILSLNKQLDADVKTFKMRDEAALAELRGLLDDEQKKKYDALEEQRRRQEKEFMQRRQEVKAQEGKETK